MNMFEYDRSKHQSSGRIENAIASARVALDAGASEADVHASIVDKDFSSDNAHLILVAAKILSGG